MFRFGGLLDQLEIVPDEIMALLPVASDHPSNCRLLPR